MTSICFLFLFLTTIHLSLSTSPIKTSGDSCISERTYAPPTDKSFMTHTVDTGSPRTLRNRTILMIVDEYSRMSATKTTERFNNSTLMTRVYLQERARAIESFICNSNPKCKVKVRSFLQACTNVISTFGWEDIYVSDLSPPWEVVKKNSTFAKVHSKIDKATVTLTTDSELTFLSFENHDTTHSSLPKFAEVVSIEGIKEIDWKTLSQKVQRIVPAVNRYRSTVIYDPKKDDAVDFSTHILKNQRTKKHSLKLPQFNGLFLKVKEATNIWTPRDIIKYLCLAAKSPMELEYLIAIVLPDSCIGVHTISSPKDNTGEHGSIPEFIKMVSFPPDLYRPYNPNSCIALAQISPEITGFNVLGPFYRIIAQAPFALLRKPSPLECNFKDDNQAATFLLLKPSNIQKLELSEATLNTIPPLEYEVPIGVEGLQADKYALIALRQQKSDCNATNNV